MTTLQLSQTTPSYSTSPSNHFSKFHGLKSCANMADLKQRHSQIIKHGLAFDNDANGGLIKFCCTPKCGDLQYALQLFDTLPHPDTFIYNTIIKAYLQCKRPMKQWIGFYSHMLENYVLPNNFTFPLIVRACCAGENGVGEGKQVHAHVIKFGFGTDLVSQNNLVYMYGGFECLMEAKRVFDKMVVRDVISWTTLINGFCKWGLLDNALDVFEMMPERNSVSWNTMISGYVQSNRFTEAIAMFDRMRIERVPINKFVVASVLSACTGLGSLKQGELMHNYIRTSNIDLDSKLATSVINMYCKCGSIKKAFELFDGLPRKGISTWNCMIGGLAMHGQGEAAIELFTKMEMVITPDSITFINLLNACAHSGLVEKGRYYFRYMYEVHNIEPRLEHFGCMVDLLGRAGLLEEAVDYIYGMQTDASVLGALLGACKIHKNMSLGEKIGKRVIELEPHNSGRYVILANLYANASRWEDVASMRKLMEDRSVKKMPGVSVIELEGVVNEFTASGKAHSRDKEVYEMLECLRLAVADADI